VIHQPPQTFLKIKDYVFAPIMTQSLMQMKDKLQTFCRGSVVTPPTHTHTHSHIHTACAKITRVQQACESKKDQYKLFETVMVGIVPSGVSVVLWR
jgi:hypothetical protein